jgi:membrane associated rhomboid family serine protease
MNGSFGACTWLVIGVTCVVSFLGFQSRDVEEKYIFDPERILAGKEYYRLVTASFLHGGWGHLALNMVSLYSFGTLIELFLGKASFLLIYFGAVVGGDLLSLYVHRHHEYRAYGASGGVCGIIFAHVLLFPGARMSGFYLPLAIPGWLYAIGFLVGSFYALKAGRDNVGHDAHLGGAIIGLLITAALEPWAMRANRKVFATVLTAAVLLLVYLWVNPLFLPATGFLRRLPGSRKRRARMPKHKRETLAVDAILEKVAASGIQSLTPEERTLLEETAGKYQRRAQSKKPESDLII